MVGPAKHNSLMFGAARRQPKKVCAINRTFSILQSKLHRDAEVRKGEGLSSYGIVCYKCYAQPYSGGTSNANFRPFRS